MVKNILPGSKKRQPPSEILEGQPQKKRKMDHGVKIECVKILKTLMAHKYGPLFSQPMDPVEPGIPDYSLIITHPMDLGKIRVKLEDDTYSSSEAFSADIKLTFANAMRYNPTNTWVHLMAKELNDLFDKTWRSIEAKLIKQSKNAGEQDHLRLLVKISKQGCTIVKQIGPQNGRSMIPLDTVKKPSNTTGSKPVRKRGLNGGLNVKAKKTDDTSNTSTCSAEKQKPSISCEEKARLKKELMVALRGDLTGPMRGFLRKYGLIHSRKENIESVFGSFGEDTLWELKRVVKCSLATSTEKGMDDNLKIQRTMEISERKKLEEKSDIGSRIRAAHAAKEARVQKARSIDLQMRRNRERERLEKMERTITLDDNLTALRELEKLCQYSKIKNPLEKHGLRLKDEYYYGHEYIDDDDDCELEDGEIC